MADPSAVVILGGARDNTGQEVLAQSGLCLYNYDKRPRRDLGFTILYVGLAALATFWGIAAFVHTDPNAGLYTYDFFQNSTTCDVQQYSAAHPPGDDDYESLAKNSFMGAFKTAVSIWLPITAVLAVAFSALYLYLFRNHSQGMVKWTIIVSVLSGLAFSIVCFASGAVPFGIILLICTLLSALFYWWIRDQLVLCGELLGLAGRGLNENIRLIPASLGIQLAGLCVLVYGVAAFFSAVNIGRAVVNPTATLMNKTGPDTAYCVDANLYPVDCCAFRTTGWAGAYAFFDAVWIFWTAFLIMEIKLFTVADVTAQWYFSGSSAGNAYSSAAVGGAALATGSVRLALSHVLTCSFGSVAFAAAVLAVLRALRHMLQRSARNNILCCILNCIAQPLLALAEKFTRFATIATAITGQPFVAGAKTVFETLKRNFLNTYSMWWVPDRVLQFAAFIFSLTWAGIVFFSTSATYRNNDEQWGIAFAVAFSAFGIVFYTLNFMAGILLDVTNTLYICYAMDKDQRKVTHPEVHAMFVKVPGLAVENPDGQVMYGSPVAHAQPQATYTAVPPPYPGAQMVPMAGSSYPAYPAYPPAPVVQPPPPPAGYGALPTQADKV
ncbi:hypothetical protein HYH03_011021 [Edaphochlamys debaryana]|uniref:Choline transporter-like protein n=1 Tax=Edaphochlamys debaryana TaxID=47281 RepID=A0A836BVN3_9CHLO|nr:hypothetical protein HYH03_011021 [Edaphochlamys debaryana]|eukprot:KAG2490630.1 hypothetical protein HYH03_011021 [Edaphochlamys debaryana]